MAPFSRGALGQAAEDLWSDHRKRQGRIVFPVTACENNTGLRGAPSALIAGEPIAMPDFLLMGDRTELEEVKGKSRPSWWRLGARWEHGIDFAIYREYKRLQASQDNPFAFALFEVNSPECPDCGDEMLPIAASQDAPEGMRSRCVGCHVVLDGPACRPLRRWLMMWMEECEKYGQPRSDWPRPGGNGSRNREGGWLWPRNRMTPLEVAQGARRASAPKGHQFKMFG